MGSNPTRCARKPFAFASGFFHAVLQEKRHFPGQKVPKFGPLFLSFFLFFFLSFPYFLWSSPPVLPFLYFQLKISFHGMRRSEFGRIVEMGINIGCSAEISMPQPFLDMLQRHAVSPQQAGAAVPLRYNNDKRKKPLFSRGLSVCRHLFNSFSKLKCDEKIIEKRRLFH